jgi:hypothetical protein
MKFHHCSLSLRREQGCRRFKHAGVIGSFLFGWSQALNFRLYLLSTGIAPSV